MQQWWEFPTVVDGSPTADMLVLDQRIKRVEIERLQTICMFLISWNSRKKSDSTKSVKRHHRTIFWLKMPSAFWKLLTDLVESDFFLEFQLIKNIQMV